MCATDLDLPEIAEDEQAASPDPGPVGGQYAGVAWGLAEAGPAEAGPAEAGPAEAGPAEAGPAEAG